MMGYYTTGYIGPTRQKPRVLRLMFVAFALAGGGMWLIAQAFAGAVGFSNVPLEAIPFGMWMTAAGHLLAYYTAHTMLRRDKIRTYHS